MHQTLVDRPDLLHRVWTTLEFDSVLLSGPRRIGKTSLLRLMEAHPKPSFDVIYTSVQGFNLEDAGRAIAQNLIESRREDFPIRAKLKSLTNFSKEPDLVGVVENTLQYLDQKRRLVLMIDEFTWLLSQSEEHVGRNIFDVLRHLRMSHPRLRMVFAGESIENLGPKYADLGFFNDLSVIAIPNLNTAESYELVSKQAKSAGVNMEPDLRRRIAEIGDGNPYFIKTLAQRVMRSEESGQSELESRKALDEEAEIFRDQLLADMLEETLWRIDRTYGEKVAREINRILDVLANGYQSRIPILEIVGATKSPTREALRVLELAGILNRTKDDYVSFRHALIRQWWRENKRSDTHGRGDARLEEAVDAYRLDLRENTRDTAPLAWANTQTNLGNALVRLGDRESSTLHLEEAIVAFRNALAEHSRERVPLDWANTHLNLSLALLALARQKEDQSLYKDAIRSLDAASSFLKETEYEDGEEKVRLLLQKAHAVHAVVFGSDPQ